MRDTEKLRMKVLRREFAEYLEATGLQRDVVDVADVRRGPGGTFVLYSGPSLIAQFQKSYTAKFLVWSIGALQQLFARIDALEAAAYSERARARRLRGVERLLWDARRHGPRTRDGLRAIEDAIRVLEENSEHEAD